MADAVAKEPIQEYPSAAAPASGVSLAAALREVYEIVNDGVGSTFWVKKTVTSSDILLASALDITGVSSGGELQVEDVIVKTDSTGLAGGTNFELKSNNANGLANIFVETVANLDGNKTVDLASASVTGIKTVLEEGKKLQVQSTGADDTGSGTIDIYVKFRRLAQDATIAAA